MGGLFAVDGKGFRFLSTASDLVILNLLWLLCCLPIVTIGASTTALYAMLIKMVRHEDGYLVRGFFSSFRLNLRQATGIWLIFLGVIAVLYFDFYFSAHAPFEGAAVLFVPFAMVAGLLALTMLYVFPMQAVFENRIWKTFKNSLFMALAHLPISVLALVVAMGPAAVVFLLSDRLGLALFFDLVIGFAFFAWVNAHLFAKVFQRFLTE